MSMEIEVRSSLVYDGGRPLPLVNQTEYSSEMLFESTQVRELAYQLSGWVENTRKGLRSSIFDRAAYTPPSNPYDEMRTARYAARHDSIVSGMMEVTESFAFEGVKWESSDPDEADAFNQLATDQNLDFGIRQMWRDEFVCGQFVVAGIWEQVEYTVRGMTKSGNRRKRTFKFWAPTKLRTLDPELIVPLQSSPIADELLAYSADKALYAQYSKAVAGDIIDPVLLTYYQGIYDPNIAEKLQLAEWGVSPDRLLVMNPDLTFRHTITRGSYEKQPDLRLKSLFSLLDLKQQLLQADRAALIGSANYILLIRKGSKEQPAQPEELANLRENYSTIAKMPVIISDHRLEVEIVSPKTDLTLAGEKYDVIDHRILTRLLGAMTLPSHGRSAETSTTVAASMARVMQSRRKMIGRTLESQIARKVLNHPRNRGVFATEPNLVYTPRNVALSMDQSYVQALLGLRTQREISRETILEFFGLDEAVEAQRMQLEEEIYDQIFKTAIPFNSPQNQPGGQGEGGQQNLNGDNGGGQNTGGRSTPNGTGEAPNVSGARGGRPRGGGRTPQSPGRQAAPRTGNGNPSTRASDEED